MNTIDATRIARTEGYREQVEQLVKEAAQLPPDVVDANELRLKYVAAMGDFVGFAPKDLDSFDSLISNFAISHSGAFMAVSQDGGLSEIVEIASGKVIEKFQLPDVEIRCLEFIDENDALLAIFANGNKYAWHRVASSWVASLPPDTHLEIKQCSLSPDGHRYAAVLAT